MTINFPKKSYIPYVLKATQWDVRVAEIDSEHMNTSTSCLLLFYFAMHILSIKFYSALMK